jgi:hypothetical protein
MQVLAFKGKNNIIIKITVNEGTLEQVLNFNYFGFNVGSANELDNNEKL